MQVLTTDEFADWFRGLRDVAAEEVATALDLVDKLGPRRAAPSSSELLLWYEHPAMSRLEEGNLLALTLEGYGTWRHYAERVVEHLQSPPFAARLLCLSVRDAATVLRAIAQIQWLAGPVLRWDLRSASAGVRRPFPPEVACDQIRHWYFVALGAAGFEVADVPLHSSALRELVLTALKPRVRLLYGVDVPGERALFVLGEELDRHFYGDSVRRAERLWKQFMEGELRAQEPANVR